VRLALAVGSEGCGWLRESRTLEVHLGKVSRKIYRIPELYVIQRDSPFVPKEQKPGLMCGPWTGSEIISTQARFFLLALAHS
jgi:hypothetical protein